MPRVKLRILDKFRFTFSYTNQLKILFTYVEITVKKSKVIKQVLQLFTFRIEVETCLNIIFRA